MKRKQVLYNRHLYIYNSDNILYNFSYNIMSTTQIYIILIYIASNIKKNIMGFISHTILTTET